MVVAVVTPRGPITELDPRTGTIKLTREGFLFLDQLNRQVTDIASALIIDTIADGIHDQAPSSNAVFDAITAINAAIALKANASSLSAYLTIAAAALAYQPLDSQLTSIAGLADASGALTNDGAGVFSYVSTGSVTIGTSVATTAVNAIDFTGLVSPKILLVSMAETSTNGTSEIIIQLGTSGGIQATNYKGSAASVASTGTNVATMSSGFLLNTNGGGAAFTRNGTMIFTLLDSATGTYAGTGGVGLSDSARISVPNGTKALAGVLDRFRVTTVGAADLFDTGGIINYAAIG